jgi:two-component system cell cycle sensor histidine kinase/response regulator CckA
VALDETDGFQVMAGDQTGRGAASGAGVPSRPAPTARVLVVDDDDILRRLLVSMLRLGGYEILSAAHGEEALELAAAREGAIDLVVTDVLMPGLSGPELAERLRARYPHLAVIFITGGAQEAPPGTLRKPFSVRAFLNVVGAALRRET